MELAKLLSKLEGVDDPMGDVVSTRASLDHGDATMSDDDGGKEGEDGLEVHRRSTASAADFGQSSASDDHDHDHEEHLHHDDDHHHGGQMPHDAGDFFRRAFSGGPFGAGGGGGGFHYFSSSGGGFGHGYGGGGRHGEEDHRVECNQM